MTMQKTDAELIAEANDWAAELLSEDCGHTSQMIVELARRLKAANIENERLRNRWWMNVITEVGVYPASVSGGGEFSYENRTDFMEGWNACVTQYGLELTKALREEGFLDKPPVWPGDL